MGDCGDPVAINPRGETNAKTVRPKYLEAGADTPKWIRKPEEAPF